MCTKLWSIKVTHFSNTACPIYFKVNLAYVLFNISLYFYHICWHQVCAVSLTDYSHLHCPYRSLSLPSLSIPIIYHFALATCFIAETFMIIYILTWSSLLMENKTLFYSYKAKIMALVWVIWLTSIVFSSGQFLFCFYVWNILKFSSQKSLQEPNWLHQVLNINFTLITFLKLTNVNQFYCWNCYFLNRVTR